MHTAVPLGWHIAPAQPYKAPPHKHRQGRRTGEKGTVKTWAPPGLRMRRSSWKPWYGRGMRDISCKGRRMCCTQFIGLGRTGRDRHQPASAAASIEGRQGPQQQGHQPAGHTHVAGQDEVEGFVLERGALQVFVADALNHLARRDVAIDVLAAQGKAGAYTVGGCKCVSAYVHGLRAPTTTALAQCGPSAHSHLRVVGWPTLLYTRARTCTRIRAPASALCAARPGTVC